MKKTLLIALATAATLAIIIATQTKSFTKIPAPPVAVTGAPSETTCAKSGCHSGSALTPTTEVSMTATLGSGSAQDVFATWEYMPDSTYTMNVTVLDLTGRYGFETTCLKSSDNTMAGSYTITDATNTSALSSGGRNYVGHKSASSLNTWSFQWKAPATGTGDIVFYLAAMASNNNNNSTGDKVYKTSASCAEKAVDTATGISQVKYNAHQMVLGPNPCKNGRFMVQYKMESSADAQLTVRALNGATVYATTVQHSGTGMYSQLVEMDKQAKGVYFVTINDGSKETTRELSVQ